MVNSFTSVIIPVFNDSKGLRKCLKALQNQTYPEELFETIVVDNNSDQDIKTVVDQFDKIIFAHETYPTSYAARNKGIFLAKGEVLAFTDADCIPAPDWIEKGVKNLFSIPGCGMVGGKVNLLFRNPNKPTTIELYESIMHFRQKEFVEKYKFSPTCNLFTYKHVFKKVGLFNATLKSCGDLEWGCRVYSVGYKQVYTDEACIVHPARSSFTKLCKRIIRIAGGEHSIAATKKFSFTIIVKNLVTRVLLFFRDIFIICFDKRLKEGKQRVKVFLVFLYVKSLRVLEKIRLHLGGKPKGRQ